MAITKKQCHYHPNRPAIGVCVELGIPICAECSTRYEGVNYSREGLRILRERRVGEAGRGSFAQSVGGLLLTLAAPLMFYLIYLSYFYSFQALIDWAQLEL